MLLRKITQYKKLAIVKIAENMRIARIEEKRLVTRKNRRPLTNRNQVL